MTQVDTLISTRWILPIIPKNEILENHSIAFTNGRISALLPTPTALTTLQAQNHIQLDQHIIMPGLVNAHSHSPMTLFRGLADDLPLMEWLQKHMWPAEEALISETMIADGSRLAILEMIRSGTTCFADQYFFHDVTADVSIEMGMRCCVSPVIIQVPTAFATTEQEYLRKAELTLANRKQHPLLHWAIAPHSPYAVTDNGLLQCQEFAEKFNVPIHMHLHESREEIEQSLAKHQQRPIKHLTKLGLLTPRFVGVHMVHINAEDMALITAANISIVHCPESSLKLANGIAPITEMLNQGLNVALGTDGAASNNNLDMFAELHSASLLAKVEANNPTALPAFTALTMATLNGAKAFKMEHEIGSLEIGKAADVIAIDMDYYNTQPIYNPISHLVYAVNSFQVSDVWIAGKQLLQKGHFNLDTEEIVHQAQRWSKRAQRFSGTPPHDNKP